MSIDQKIAKQIIEEVESGKPYLKKPLLQYEVTTGPVVKIIDIVFK